MVVLSDAAIRILDQYGDEEGLETLSKRDSLGVVVLSHVL